MNIRARILLEDVVGLPESDLSEAVVRLPPRSSRWLAVYTGPGGGQVARSTGLRDREAALALAKRWESEARRIRQASQTGRQASRPSRSASFALTQAEVAIILNISERAVRAIEKRAIRKLRQHPALRDMWVEHQSGRSAVAELVEENTNVLNEPEIEALLGLAQTEMERRALVKAIRVLRQGP